MTTVTNNETLHYFAHRKAVRNGQGSLRGVCYFDGSGRYPADDLPGDADYYIYSYATPIAWFKDGKWFIPDHKYSSTTSRHQSLASYISRNSGSYEDPVEMKKEKRLTVRGALKPTEMILS